MPQIIPIKRTIFFLLATVMLCAFAEAEEAAPAASELDARLKGVAAVLEGVNSTEVSVSDTVSPGDGAEARVLDAKDCVNLTLRNHPRALITDEKVNERRAQAGVARSAALPQVKAGAAWNHVTGLETDVYGGEIAQRLLNFGDIQPEKSTYTATLGVEQVLYAGGQIRAAVAAAAHLEKSEEWKRRVELMALAHEARSAYWDALAARGMVDVARDSIAAFGRHLADARTKMDQGMASKFEVLRAETELRARESDLEAALAAEQLAMLRMRYLLALPGDEPFRLAGGMGWTPLDTPVDDLIAEALKQRPEMAALDEAAAAAGKNIEVKSGQRLPRAAAQAKYNQTAGGGQLMPDGWTFTLGAELPIYAGGRIRAEEAEARAQARTLELERTNLARLVELDVRQAHTRAVEAVARIRKEEAARVLGEEGRSLAELRFQQGAGIQADTLDAELALTLAQTSLVQALRDYAVAIASLDKALGRIPPGAEELLAGGCRAGECPAEKKN